MSTPDNFPSLLRFTTCQSSNAEPALVDIMRYLSLHFNALLDIDFDLPWQERYAMLDAGTMDAAWICGLPYIKRADQPDPIIELLVAPVMRGERYQGRPIYFSDVIVRSDSPFHSFADLRGARWAINERGSHSGYNVVRWHLAKLKEDGSYFGSVIESGAHLRSLQMILDGEIDASAIDSTVLETELRNDQSLSQRLRRVEIIGPSPIPPWVISRRLVPDVRDYLRQIFLKAHEDERGRAVLAAGDYAYFASVTDHHYDSLREMTSVAQTVSL